MERGFDLERKAFKELQIVKAEANSFKTETGNVLNMVLAILEIG